MLRWLSHGLTEATVLLGERIKAKSWVVGVTVFADHIREKVLSKEYQSFSIGGRGGEGAEGEMWVRWR